MVSSDALPSGDGDLDRRLTAILEISQAINLSLALPDMLTLLAQKVHRLMGYDCAVILLDPDTLLLTWVGVCGLSDEYVRRANEQQNTLKNPEMSNGATGRAYRSRRPVQITDLYHESVRLWRNMALEEGIHGFIATPMIVRDDVLGFINCYTRRPQPFSQREIELLSIMANQAAIAVDAANVHHAERQRRTELTALNETLREHHELVEHQYAQLRQAEQIHQQLTAISLSGGGLEEIVQRISDLIRQPVVLYDESFRQLAAARTTGEVDGLHRACLDTGTIPPALREAASIWVVNILIRKEY